MKGNIILYAIAIFIGTWFFIDTWGVYTLLQQEDVQLFIPEWSEIYHTLQMPGGACELAAKAIVQYYTSPTTVLLILSTLITLIGILTYLLLEHIAPRIYHFFLAFLPIYILTKAHCSAFYVLDGTIGILLLLLFLFGYTLFTKPKIQLGYTLFSTLIVYLLCGQLVALYTIGMSLLSFLRSTKEWKFLSAAFALGIGLTYLTLRYTTCIPLTDGIYSQAYQESQLQPDSFMYFIWIRWMFLLMLLLVITWGMKQLPWKKTGHKIFITLLSAGAAFGFIYLQLPDRETIINNRMEHLAYLRQQKDWNGIIEQFREEYPSNYFQHNHLCLALAQKGQLGDQLFRYNPQGPQTLLVTWDRRYYTSSLLSDIHYAIGDISLAESYAMEGLTLAKRGGSPRMMQRLIEISLVREEWALAQKYLNILERMPAYRTWTKQQQPQLYQPSNRMLSQQSDQLFSLLSVDQLWEEYLHRQQPNPIAQAYLGCSYLLAKELDKFKQFLLEQKGTSLPKHFQEALLIIAIQEPSMLETLTVDASTINQFKLFQQDIRKTSKDNFGLKQLQRKYGDTYWFYYYCKN